MKRLFNQYYTALCLFSYKITQDDLVAQDIVQEAFIRLHEERKHREIRFCRPWLYRVVKNASLNAVDKQRRTENGKNNYADFLFTGNSLVEKDAEQLMISTEVSRQLWHEIHRLPAQMQQIVRMHFLESMSIREISMALQLHVSTVKTQKQRGIALLRKYINFMALMPAIFSFCNFFS